MRNSSNAKHRWGAAGSPIRVATQSAAWAGVALPAAATIGAPVHAPVWQGLVGSVIAAASLVAAGRLAGARNLPPIGLGLVAIACWLLAQSSYPVAAWLIAPMLGVGIGFAAGNDDVRQMTAVRVIVALASVALIAGVRATLGRDSALGAGGLLVAAGALASFVDGRVATQGRHLAALALASLVLAAVTSAYIGATTPSVTWFGSLRSHGPRNGDEVAITFDDGPNPPYTLQISAILDRYGVKGTFFTVGKALEARPDVSKALLDDGQLLGNHSYHHDAFSWLDPRYQEVGQTQEAFKRTLGVCPALFRPPHGSHTPFMAHQVDAEGMTMVTWDVSAGDWATTDGALVAKRVLDHVRGGSIILLHDGIDGNIGADRSVILAALPLILDGLRARGLQPVTLDKLLGVAGYVKDC